MDDELTMLAVEHSVDSFVFGPADDPIRQTQVFAAEVAPAVREAVARDRHAPERPAPQPAAATLQQQSRAEILAGRYGDPAEFGSVGAFPFSKQASYVTGTAVRCDGGLVRSL